ncbi:MAG: hypothetical protein IJX65_08940 [Alistipes sp.]|nr:hypothetical protein [Alistipes sp.]
MKRVLSTILYLAIAAIIVWGTIAASSDRPEPEVEIIPVIELKDVRYKTSYYERHFNNLQDTHIEAAERLGVEPLKARSDVDSLIKEGRLVEIATNHKYHVRNLTYSVPYVVPEAEQLIVDLATLFQELCGTGAKFEITSVTRTDEDIARLRRRNGNATKDSCHRYGTTIDISYTKFQTCEQVSIEPLRRRLAVAVYTLQQQGRCYVKKERKQYCYHITVR